MFLGAIILYVCSYVHGRIAPSGSVNLNFIFKNSITDKKTQYAQKGVLRLFALGGFNSELE